MCVRGYTSLLMFNFFLCCSFFSFKPGAVCQKKILIHNNTSIQSNMGLLIISVYHTTVKEIDRERERDRDVRGGRCFEMQHNNNSNEGGKGFIGQ